MAAARFFACAKAAVNLGRRVSASCPFPVWTSMYVPKAGATYGTEFEV
jgi:hypothetical protein